MFVRASTRSLLRWMRACGDLKIGCTLKKDPNGVLKKAKNGRTEERKTQGHQACRRWETRRTSTVVVTLCEWGCLDAMSWTEVSIQVELGICVNNALDARCLETSCCLGSVQDSQQFSSATARSHHLNHKSDHSHQAAETDHLSAPLPNPSPFFPTPNIFPSMPCIPCVSSSPPSTRVAAPLHPPSIVLPVETDLPLLLVSSDLLVVSVRLPLRLPLPLPLPLGLWLELKSAFAKSVERLGESTMSATCGIPCGTLCDVDGARVGGMKGCDSALSLEAEWCAVLRPNMSNARLITT
jgi:hypothetical protein